MIKERGVNVKIFIGGSQNINDLDESVKEKLLSIYQKGFNVFVGDCYGVDTSVQSISRKNSFGIYATV